MTAPPHTRLNLSAALASVTGSLALVGLKLWALGETGALSVAASLADSGMDMMISLGAFVAIWYAARPADEDHTFGHSSAEDLAALGQSLFLMVVAGVIAWAAIVRLTADTPPVLAAEGRGMIAMAGSILLTLALVLWQRHVAARTGSRVIEADSLHYLGDLLPNIGAILSLWASSRFGLTQIDSIVALGAALMLAVGAAGIFRGAWNALMDRAADPGVVARIEEITGTWPSVLGFHDLQTRTSGSRIFVNLHIELDGGLTLNEAHHIGDGLEHRLEAAIDGAEVIIHLDPVGPGSGRQTRG